MSARSSAVALARCAGEQVVLVARVVVQRLHLDAEPSTELPHRQRVIATLVGEVQGCAQQPIATLSGA